MTDEWILKFPANDAGESEGLGDAGIETFKDSPYASVARECGQNSRDAASAKPVILTFDVLEVKPNSIPSIEILKADVALCLKAAEEKDSEKEIEFFQQATAALDSETIRILRIADTNTKGLAGPCVEGKPFHSLLKGAGVSVKESNVSGGSFGIGKNAAFAVSDLQTAFYSTVYLSEKTNEPLFLAQGKTKLVSHKNAEGLPVRQTGYWGNPVGYLPVSDTKVAPNWLKRSEVGTSVFSVGFREVEHWEYRIAYSVLQNFFPAIHRGDMAFAINADKIKIDKLSLNNLFVIKPVVEAAERDGHEDDFRLSSAFLECLTSPETIEVFLEIKGLGKVSLKLLIQADLPRRVAIVRNGMLITTDLKNFGEKFQRFTGVHDFVAIVEPIDNEGLALFKRLENPRHDELSAERIADKEKRDLATRVMRELGRRVRDSVKEYAAVSQADAVNLDELGKFFADGDARKKTDNPDAEEDLNSVIVYEPEKRTKQKKKRPDATSKADTAGKGESGDGSLNGGHKGGSGGGGGKGGGGGEGAGKGVGTDGIGAVDSDGGNSPGIKAGKAVDLLEVRNVIPTATSSKTRKVFFTTDESGTIILEAKAAGLTDAVPLSIVAIEGASAKDGRGILEVEKGKRMITTLTLAEPYDGPMELVASGAEAPAKGKKQ